MSETDKLMERPQGSNADEWLLFLTEYKDALPYVAVQIATAIEVAQNGLIDKLAALKQARKDIDDNPPHGSEWYPKFTALHADLTRLQAELVEAKAARDHAEAESKKADDEAREHKAKVLFYKTLYPNDEDAANAVARLKAEREKLREALGDLISDAEKQMANPSYHMPFSLPKARAALSD